MATFNDTKRFGCAALASALFFAAPQALAQPADRAATNAGATAKKATDSKPTAANGVGECRGTADVCAEAADKEGQTLYKEARAKRDRPAQNQGFGKALLQFEAAIRLNPRRWKAHAHKAVCLYYLGRVDEAFDTYNFLFAEFEKEVNELRDQEKQLPKNQRISERIDHDVEKMSQQVGTVTLTVAEKDVMVFIDGRLKFDGRSKKLPSFAPISVSVMPGPHLVRVYKEEFEVFEQEINAVAGKPERVVAGLTLIKEPGFITIPEIPGHIMEILIDGVPVDRTGKEQTFSVMPGDHSVSLRMVTLPHDLPRDTCDSGANAKATISNPEETETNLASEPVVKTVQPDEHWRLKAEELKVRNDLKAVLRITPYPRNARVTIDDKFVGRGVYVGRTTEGNHRVKIEAEGYFDGKEEQVTTIDDEVVDKELQLEKDLNAARWGRRRKVFVEAYGGVALAPSFGGELAAQCTNDCQENLGVGPRAGLRVGYENARGFGFGLSAGYLQLKQTRTGVDVTLTKIGTTTPYKGKANDTTNIETLAIGAYGSYKLGERFPLRLGLGAGVLLGNVTYQRVATFSKTMGGPLLAGPLTQSGFSPWIYVEPEACIGVQITEGLSIGINISGMVLIAPNIPTWMPKMEVKARGENGSSVTGMFPRQTLTAGVFFAINQSVYVQYGF